MKRHFQRNYPILIPYQIDFNTTTVGRHIRQTKRHVNWRFGFAHIPSVLDNKTGVACRGLEMEIHLVWSVASGKHILYLNNVMVHQTYPASSSSYAMVPAQRFEHSMYVPEEMLPGGHVIHITAWALGFGSHSSPENQFVLLFDGQSYREFYPIYMLGSSQMRAKYSVALEKAREKLNRLAGDGDGEEEKEATETTNNNDVTSSRTRRTYPNGDHDHSHPNNSSHNHYWEKPTVPLPATFQTTILYPTTGVPSSQHHDNKGTFRPRSNSNASAPDLLPPDITLGDVARNDREEETMLAKARLESFRDLKKQQEQRAAAAATKYVYATDQRQEEQFIAKARLSSFRDIRGSGDDASMGMSIPSFARPPPVPIMPTKSSSASPSPSMHRTFPQYPTANANTNNTTTRHHHSQQTSHYLKTVQEGVDLLDMDDDHHDESRRAGLMRSESSLTLDTAIQSPDDDLMSMTSGMSEAVYSHLDPRQNWRTQQNLSFRLQRPPIYADTLAGDLIQPSSSSSASFANHMWQKQQQQQHTTVPPPRTTTTTTTNTTYAGTNTPMNYSTHTTSPPSSSTPMGVVQGGPGFVAAPPPTWESLQEAFAMPPANSSASTSSTRYPNANPSWQQPSVFR
eukprot:CAMPEP_0176496510 /NCGR_PEP_ID=MMETSP0200_2-20121128/11231_1 /TAXON_ID=947934 /ORGANISM="Chaetoceros sp., Strain GSL56" /LENGTH=624 /DNA_ID=CAMNT_0017894465 /DNA_START=104 /DNA_END=1978 /DNA_ORIENTATION=-